MPSRLSSHHSLHRLLGSLYPLLRGGRGRVCVAVDGRGEGIEDGAAGESIESEMHSTGDEKGEEEG